MAILFTSTVVLAVIFYLYVLVQFGREEKRLKRGNQKTSSPALPITRVA